jgi:trans-aconitate 2-methyltransferase
VTAAPPAGGDGPAPPPARQPVGRGWDPDQYNRFASEREQPFWDLAALLRPAQRPRLVDLGCGDGRLTAQLAARLGAASALGLDSSPEMLAAAAGGAEGVELRRADIGSWSAPATFDVVFSNAALQWVPDHRATLSRWAAALAPGGQLAVQVPANADHPSHRVARQLAGEWLGPDAPPDPVDANVLAPEDYAVILDRLGFADQHVRLVVYGHRLESAGAVVEWVKGTSLTRFRAVLDPDGWDRFVAEYRRRLRAVLGDGRPYFYPFKRILLWGRRPTKKSPNR